MRCYIELAIMKLIISIVLLLSINYVSVEGRRGMCQRSITTYSGSSADVSPGTALCKGDLIFHDDFNTLNTNKWKREVTVGGGGNNEFQWYTSNPANSYVKGGVLYLTPTYTEDYLGSRFLTSQTLNLNGHPPANEQCTNSQFNGCSQSGSEANIIQPIRSAKLHTKGSFSFKYGKVEVRAKIPSGDWLWPGIWLLSKSDSYGNGTWPASGEIDMMEARGNQHLTKDGVNIGSERITSALHFGPRYPYNGYEAAMKAVNSPRGMGYDKNYHDYQMEWTRDYIRFSVDDVEHLKVPAGEGFWKRGNFHNILPHENNVWQRGTVMAPFDKEFYLILNLAVGGNFFPPDAHNRSGKPWKSNTGIPKTDFWNGRSQWQPSWQSTQAKSLLIAHVKVWAA